MTKHLGIDVRSTCIRVAELEVSYRKTTIQALYEVDRAHFPSVVEAVKACAGPLAIEAETIATAVAGDQAFFHRIELPLTAQRQLDEVLPFELEAQVPIDLDELSFDHRVLPREANQQHLAVLTAAARTEHVRASIAICREAIGREPDRVSCGALPLANLCNVCSELAGPGPIALIDLGATTTEVVFLSQGQAMLARTISRGVQGLPQTAPALAAALRQTLARWGVTAGTGVQAAYLLGGGAAAQGADEYLAYELGVTVLPLPSLHFDSLTPDQALLVPRFAKAIGLALSVGGRARDLNLRQGDLAYQRGYGFIKEKVPLLAGLAGAIAISFFFSAWAESVSLGRENEALKANLAAQTNAAFGREILDPDEVLSELDRLKKKTVDDPMPEMDALDIINEISKAVPMDTKHDIEEFDLARNKVKIRAIVGSTDEAQAISTALEEHDCFEEVKIGKITQVVNESRQKYSLDFDVNCDAKAKKKKPAAKSTEGKEE